MAYKVAKVDGKDLEKFLNGIGEITFLSIFPITTLMDWFTVIYAVKEKKKLAPGAIEFGTTKKS